jgi:hypothetical protein
MSIASTVCWRLLLVNVHDCTWCAQGFIVTCPPLQPRHACTHATISPCEKWLWAYLSNTNFKAQDSCLEVLFPWYTDVGMHHPYTKFHLYFKV